MDCIAFYRDMICQYITILINKATKPQNTIRAAYTDMFNPAMIASLKLYSDMMLWQAKTLQWQYHWDAGKTEKVGIVQIIVYIFTVFSVYLTSP